MCNMLKFYLYICLPYNIYSNDTFSHVPPKSTCIQTTQHCMDYLKIDYLNKVA
jgi:hypothetical protein